MMKRLTFIILTLIILSYTGILSMAAVDRETSPEEAVDAVVEERLAASQEYHQYKLREKSKKKAPVQIRVPVIPKEEEALYARSKDDIIIGMGLILAAIVLTIYLHQLTKKEQKA